MLGPLFLLGVLGLTGATLVLGDALLVMFGVPQLSIWAVLPALPIAAFEMIFVGWLIVKGFNPSQPLPSRHTWIWTTI